MNKPLSESADRHPLIQQPSFLVGAERSGTTVLRLMLDSHPKLAWCGEFEYAVDRIPAEDGWPQLDAYYEFLATNRIFQIHGFDIDRSLSYPALIDSFLVQRRQRAQKPLIGATVHRNFDKLLRIWPKARLIHLVRDGRDVARSTIGMGWAGNVWTGAKRWQVVETLWDRLRPQLDPDQYIEITYESLIQTPEATLQQICAFLELPYDPAMFDYAKTTVYDLPDPAFLNQWRQKLSDYEIRLVESRLGEQLQQRHYPLSGLPPLKITPPLKLGLLIQDRLFRARYRIRKYGLGLYGQSVMANRLGATAWQKRVRQRCYAIDFEQRRQQESKILQSKGVSLPKTTEQTVSQTP